MLIQYLTDTLAPLTAQPRQILLALSGGLDSRVLLDLLASYRDQYPQHDYSVCHVHHGLQADADKWAAQCQVWAEQAGFSFILKHVTLDPELSTEHAAREARYQAFQELLQPHGLVLTAQHSDDQVETFFLALKRGSGLEGLAGMPTVRKLGKGLLVRPLLAASRAQLHHYARQKGLAWVEDPSNQDTHFDRNFIRQQWLPEADARWPGFRTAVQRTQQLCQEQAALLATFVAPLVENAIDTDNSLSLAHLPLTDLALCRAMLRHWLKYHDLILTQAQLNTLIQDVVQARADANPQLSVDGKSIRRYQQRLYLIADSADVTAWQGKLTPQSPLHLPDGLGRLVLLPYTERAHGLALGPLPQSWLSVQFNPSGLSAHPAGRQGRRKLKKLYQEYGIPSWRRRRLPILCDERGVIAVADCFVSQSAVGKVWRLVWERENTA
ncbi:tRNA lysidine(34) synthetase TilS [Salinivibrio costicola]|uniref:tRNA(Ile)-lysidine synthase n=1 Tax=Salinivibrio costicola TaxID=51367 RepID=A0ABX6K1T8_SALCS|nr:tRNA lysidine(34) synthetase TilS [Salinivibrio costicola]QIR05531.1 tRNA lysidine(34) synthetase TilS [Salinivibrio costicola]